MVVVFLVLEDIATTAVAVAAAVVAAAVVAAVVVVSLLRSTPWYKILQLLFGGL
jgi:hypothetical protein